MDFFDNLCRSCMSSTGPFSYFIFENVSPELYSFCTSIEVKRDDRPKSLCNHCYEMLYKFSEFKKTCLESEQTLSLGYFGTMTKLKLEHPSYCEDRDQEAKKETVHNLVETEISKNEIIQNLVETEILDTSLRDDGVDMDLSKDVVKPREKKISTSVKKKKNKKECVLNSTKQIKKPRFQCKVCRRIFDVSEKFEAHKLLHDEKKKSIHCKPCNKTFKSFSSMYQHEKHWHTLSTFKDSTCKLCSKVFQSPHSMKCHLKSHVERKPIVCEECGKEFVSNTTLKKHLEIHKSRSQIFECKHCGKKYLNKYSYTAHISRRHLERRFICDYCTRPFRDKAMLIKHIMIHEGTRKLFQCDLCPRVLTTKPSLIAHRRIHTGEKPYLCSYCPKSFNLKRNMEDHQRTHTGEKPYKCAVCEQSFIQQRAMKRHMKVHNIPSTETGISAILY